MDLIKRLDSQAPTPDEVREALRNVVDPEIGVNVVDLGLVYDVRVEGKKVHVAMTMTAPACPMSEMILEQARNEIRLTVPGAEVVEVELVWSPPWDPSKMSAAARLSLGM